MLDFNLLSPEKKQDLEKEKTILLVINLLKAFIFLLFIIFVVTFSINYSLKYLSYSQNQSFERIKKDSLIKKVLGLDAQISRNNKSITEVYNIQKKLAYLSPVIEEIINMVPDGISFKTVSFERKAQGQAVTNPTASTSATPTPSTSPSPTASSASTPSPVATNSTTNPTNQDINNYEITIEGVAKKRVQVISFEESLKSNKKFTAVVSPLQNILKPEDVDFEFTFKLKDNFSK
jgi:hypothetical protein